MDFSTWKPAIKPFFITLAFVILVGAPILHKSKKNKAPEKTLPETPVIQEIAPPPPDADSIQFHSTLIQHGWTPAAAKAVSSLNSDWLHLQTNENDLAAHKQKKLLAGLGNYGFLMP